MRRDEPIPATWCQSLNVGDRITPWLIERVTGRRCVYAERGSPGRILMAAGSILSWAARRNVVWGAGAGALTEQVAEDADIRCVRGPLSRAVALASHCPCPETYGDPALLVPHYVTVDRAEQAAAESPVIGIAAHYVDQRRALWTIGKYHGAGGDLDVHLIDVNQDVEAFVRDVAACTFVFSSSLHGLIVADAYGVPNVRCTLSDSILGDGTKYRDYMMSVGRDWGAWIDARDAEAAPLPIDDWRRHADAWRQRAPEIEPRIADLETTCPFATGAVQ